VKITTAMIPICKSTSNRDCFGPSKHPRNTASDCKICWFYWRNNSCLHWWETTKHFAYVCT